jgi:hypothetical protein
MKQVLHILTRKEDDLSRAIIERQRAMGDNEKAMVVETADLTVERPDYSALLEQIFKADSVCVW